jgi:lipopolysaccharide export system protein LptA
MNGKSPFGGPLALLVLLSVVPAARSQPQPLGLDLGNSEVPIEILADDGIEWEQQRSVVRAHGNARALRGDIQVRADVLSAFYREGPDGETEIWRLEADGGVRITSPTDSAYAEKGTYDVDSAVLVLSGGKPTRLVGKDGEVTADQQVEYWEQKRMLVARGNATAIQGEKKLKADVLVAHLQEDANGKTTLERVEAFDNVHITTAEEIVRASRGVYRADSGTATLTGTVKITRGPNQLNGCRAEVNLNTGISKLFGCAQGNGGKRVEGLFRPEPKKGK